MMSTLIMGMDLLLSATYCRDYRGKGCQRTPHDPHPPDRPRRTPQRRQVHALQSDLRPPQGHHRQPPGLHARPQLRPDLLAGGGLRADRHRRPAARQRRPAAGAGRGPGASSPSTRPTSSCSWWTAARACCRTTRPSRGALRKGGKRVIVAVNKIEGGDEGRASSRASASTRAPDLGRARPRRRRPARRGAGGGAAGSRSAEEEAAVPALAIVGRPNVGKSSLLNRFLGEERAVVSAIPGTTRDAVDSLLERKGKRYLFVDTAGIRRVAPSEGERRPRERRAGAALHRARGRRDPRARRRRGHARDGRHHRRATSRRRAAGSSSWSTSGTWRDERELKQRDFAQDVRDHLKFLAWAPVVFISAKTRQGARRPPGGGRAGRTRPGTADHDGPAQPDPGRGRRGATPPRPPRGNKPVKILFGTQIGVAPPTFVLSLNHPVDLHFSYQRYLENQFRESLRLRGHAHRPQGAHPASTEAGPSQVFS